MVLFFAAVLIILAALGALYWRWRRGVDAELAEGAAIEWAQFQKHEPEFVDHLDEASFAALYKRVNEPRFPGYALAIAATFALALPLALGAITGSIWAANKLGLTPPPAEIVRYVQLGETQKIGSWQCDAVCQLYVAEAFSGFYAYFAILIVWLGVVAFYMRRYHARRPGYLRDEIIRARN